MVDAKTGVATLVVGPFPPLGSPAPDIGCIWWQEFVAWYEP